MGIDRIKEFPYVDMFNLNPFSPELGPVPDPPPMPKYDMNEEAPMWTWTRLYNKVTKTPGSDLWPKIGGVPKDDDKPDWRGVIKNNVDVWPNPGAYKMGQKELPYMWFDTPDYADPFKKLWWSLKSSLWTGGFLWALSYARTKGPVSLVRQKALLVKSFGPVLAVGMTGSLTVLTISNLRGQVDDYWNYGIAGAVTALYMGRNDFHRGFRYMMVLPALAILVKHLNENNMHIIPQMNFRSASLGVSGFSTEYGMKSGDLRLGVRVPGKPERIGRDVRDLPHA